VIPTPNQFCFTVPTIHILSFLINRGIANPDIAGRVARMYEEGTGKKFPRFGLAYNGKDKNVGAFNDAEMAARQRSAGGGATQGSLTDSQQKTPLVGQKQKKLLFNSK